MNKRKTLKKRARPWDGWSKLAPNQKERKEMMYVCGKKCFLGPKLSFPICRKKTCKIDKKGIWSAYIRAAQWDKRRGNFKGALPYSKVKKRAKDTLKKLKKVSF